MTGFESFDANDFLSDETKQNLIHTAALGIYHTMKATVKSSIDMLVSGLVKKGLKPEEIQEKAAEDTAYARYITRIITTVSQEQVAEKLDAWRDILFAIHTGTIKEPENIDLYMRLLSDCSLQDLIALGNLYRSKDENISDDHITLKDVPDLSEDHAQCAIQRLANFGLLTPHFDKKAVWGDGTDKPNLAGLYYVRNKIGKEFMSYVGKITQKQLALV